MKAMQNSLPEKIKGIIILTIGLLMSCMIAAQDWYDSEWQYRREITVDNPGASELTDFQVQIELDGSFDFNKTNLDGSDIRITDSDGISLLPFWIELWDVSGTQASIWVKVPTIPTSGTAIFLYYGNIAATNTASGDNTFEFFDDFESSVTTEPGYYAFGPASTIMVEDQSWETSAPHTLSVVDAPGGAAYTYYGYYSLQTDGGIGMAGSNDLLNWTKFPESPAAPPNNPLFSSNGERWASVLLDGGTYYMVHTRNYSGTSNVVYRQSTDGLNWTAPVQVIPPVSGDRNQNPNIFRDPNDNQYYIYWFRRSGGMRRIMMRTASTVAGLTTAGDVELLSSASTIAAPNMLYYDGTYFLSTEIYESEWKVRIYEGSSPSGPFTILPGNPVLDDGCACLFQTHYSDMIYEYYCKLTGGTWTLDMRVVDPSTGRIIYEQGEIDDTKWTPESGGTWDAITDIQHDGTEGIVAKGNTSAKSILKSSFTGSDFILEGYGKQIAYRVWGLGFRTTNAQNTYVLNIYEDLDEIENLYLYRFSTSGNSTVWNTGLGDIDFNTWYKLSIKAYGNNFDVYIDDELKTTTPVSDNTWSSGAIGLYGEGGTVAHFNDIRVRKYATNEPSATVGDEQNQSTLIDIALFNTSCGDFEARLKPNFDIDNNHITNIQFTIKWPAGTVNLIDFSSTYGVALQGSVTVENDTNYAVFVSTSNIALTWDAGTEYTILSFSHDQSTTGYADFAIDTSNWSTANNGVYYVELLGLNYTGIVYGNASTVYLGKCGEFKALLQGPYSGSGIMSKGLTGNIPLSQPYNVEPWNYTGLETLTEMDGSIVDWVLLELRSDPTTSVEKKAALLLEDGTITQYNNLVQGVHFDNTPDGSSFYVVVYHRSHMPVMTAASTVFDGSLVDFTDETICYGSPDAEIELETGIDGMIAGDINSNGLLSYSGPGNDRGLVLARIVEEENTTNINDVTLGYFDEDVLMDYEVKYIGDNNDRAIMVTNLSTLTGTDYLNAIYQSVVPAVTTKSESINDGPIHIFMDETKNELQVKITTDEDIQNGIVDNVQFTLSWEVVSNDIVVPILENVQSTFGLMSQGNATLFEGKMHLVFVSVLPVELPNPFSIMDKVVLVSFTKDQSVDLRKTIHIADNAFTENHNGAYYISLLGKDFTGTIHTASLGIADIQDAGLSIYPNPVTSGMVHVEINLAKAQDVTITVLDIHGKVVASEIIQVNAGVSNNQIDLKNIPKGMYYIKVQADNLNAVRKLILM